MSREVRHGTTSGYAYGCRCKRCKAAKAALQRANGGNRRTGRRAEQKRRADESAKHPCADCGRLIWRTAKLCSDCEAGLRLEIKLYRWTQIERLWNEGATLRQIAEAIDSTVGAVGVAMVDMRRVGWNLPYRRPRRTVAA